MTEAYRIIPYTDDYRAQLLDLQVHHWGHDLGLRHAYLNWKYRRNPYMGEPLIHLAMKGDEVVGMRGFWGARWRAGAANVVDVPCAGDIVIAPEHRNRGLFVRLNRAALEALAERGYSYAFCVSSGMITHLGLEADGWRAIGSLRRVARGPKLKFNLDPFERFDCATWEALPSGLSLSRSTAPRAVEMTTLVERQPDDARIQPVCDVSYFRWRFENPFSKYRFLYCNAPDGNLEGYLILQCDRGRGWDVRVLDWKASGEEVRWALLTGAIERGGFDCLSLWAAGLPEKVDRALAEMGFASWNERGFLGASRPTILIKSLANSEHAAWKMGDVPLLDRTHWNLSMLCSDAF